MAEATDQQMQKYHDERLRPFAEAFRNLFLQAADHFSVIDEVFERASGSNQWDDGRADGPPVLMHSGGSADPDSIENFNLLLVRLEQLRTGTFDNVGEANQFASLWIVLQNAIVRPVTIT